MRRSSHAREMEHVEARVRAALARKDESLASAQQQIAALSAQLRNTEAVLAQQQAELHTL
ncbi:reticulocyte-binding protein 2 a [Haematococcus lacustris]|uniref:Reticulocyte-binding protein 2 a n=1 Tax=Haematococcus lacustris TaxID=44745 RepID=A0A699YT59_HAELA|nr:reticulocyte-binding protein 2 a [Haematococcus lacustris]